MPSPSPALWARRFSQPGWVLGTLVLSGVVGLIAGGAQLRAHIFKPFEVAPASSVASGAVDATQTMDTDQDGLTDYLELNVYGTSPYVPDSDSDGQTDGAEVAAKTDPNCPAGTDCSAWSTTAPASPSAEPEAQGTQGVTPVGNPDATQLTPSQLRELLIQNGVPAEQVNSLTDEELAVAWQQALQQTQQ